jgi:fructoselysine 6-kinase
VALSALGVGDNCIDRYLPPIGACFVGGQTVNVAVGLANAGIHVAYAGVVGTDDAGRSVVAALNARGIDTSRVRVVPGLTGVTDIAVDAEGERSVVAERYGVSAPMELTEDILSSARAVDLVFAAHLADPLRLAAALRGGPVLAVDLSEEAIPEAAWVREVRFLFTSRPGVEPEAIEVEAQQALAGGAGEVVCGQGAAGVMVITSGGAVRLGSRATTIVDTLGAGDALAAAYMAARLQGAAIEPALRKAVQAAAVSCQTLGGWPQTPMALEGSA